MKRRIKASILLCLALAGCIEPFEAPVEKKDVGFLVVDGYVNVSSHSASVKLSRAIPLSETSQPSFEDNATVTLQEESGKSYQLTSHGAGRYELFSNEIQLDKRYRLSIITANGKQYQSAYIVTKHSPPIDSLTWRAEEDGLFVSVNTHDDSKRSSFYRWDFTETWEYNAAFFSSLILENGVLKARPTNQPIYICYRSENASAIVTANTKDLSEDRIGNMEVAYVPKFSQKYARHYSILVKQYVLSEEGYNYWEQLKVSTENLGGLFDPQPSRVKGNISSLDGNETVIGYFDGGAVSEKRIFIKLDELPDSYKRFPRTDCEELEISLDEVSRVSGLYLITSAKVVGGLTVGYYYAVEACADCRVQGGTTTPPEFWP